MSSVKYDDVSGAKTAVLSSLKGFGAGIISALVLLAVFSAIASKANDPDTLIPIMALSALALSSFSAGICAGVFSAKSKAKPALAGGITGLLCLLPVLFFRLVPIFDGEALTSGASSVIFCFVVPLMSVAGALIFGRKSKKRRRRRRK